MLAIFGGKFPIPGGVIHIGFCGNNGGGPCESSDKFAVKSDEFRSLLRSSRKLFASISSGSSGKGGGGSSVRRSPPESPDTFTLSASSSLRSMSMLSTLSCIFLGEMPTFLAAFCLTGVRAWFPWFTLGGGGGGGSFSCSKSKCIR